MHKADETNPGHGAPLTLVVERGVAKVTLDNAAARNAIDRRSSDAMIGAIDRIADDPSVRVVLIRANGPMFCPGASMAFLAPDEPGMAERIDTLLTALNPALAKLRALDVVVVTAVHGAVAGGGLGYLNMADLAVAAQSTKFSLAYSRIGATPDLGATWYLPRMLGERRALELLLLSDGFDAEHAQALGLVNFVFADAEFRGRDRDDWSSACAQAPRDRSGRSSDWFVRRTTTSSPSSWTPSDARSSRPLAAWSSARACERSANDARRVSAPSENRNRMETARE